jgi:hypothetical protein
MSKTLEVSLSSFLLPSRRRLDEKEAKKAAESSSHPCLPSLFLFVALIAHPRVEKHHLRQLKVEGGPCTYQGYASVAQLQGSDQPFGWFGRSESRELTSFPSPSRAGYRFRDFDRGGSALASNGTDVSLMRELSPRTSIDPRTSRFG